MEKSLLKFSQELYGSTVSDQKKNTFHNTCLCPYSVYTALSSTLCGCDGETKKQLANALHLPVTGICKDTASTLKKLISCASEVEISSANKIFVENSAHIHQSFINEVKELFESEPKNVDFAKNPDNARKEMNQWVSSATHDKIKELFSPGSVSCNTRLVLGNAVYFKGAWKTPFNPADTFQGQFHKLGGDTCPVKMMRRNGNFNIEEEILDGVNALKLPFKDTRYELLIILPENNEQFPALVKTISETDKLERILDAPFHSQMARVRVPRFKLAMTPSLALKDTLKEMGITRLFGDADLRKIADEPLFVSDVVHQAVLEVNEAGAVASAASGVCVSNRAMLQPIEFCADHAFVVAVVVDKKVPLFIGHVTSAEE
uniref:Serine protease inhibitor 1 n=1 Tax=Fasciola hepatica TaxID=6192 RepID=A0A7G3SU95_FASHE|nr:serine protease inhibitor 1 [Fasciola hepatica]